MPLKHDALHKLMRLRSSVAPTNPYLLSEYIDDDAPKPQVGKPQVRKSQVENSQVENAQVEHSQAEKSQVGKPHAKNLKKNQIEYISQLDNQDESSRKNMSGNLAKVRLKPDGEHDH